MRRKTLIRKNLLFFQISSRRLPPPPSHSQQQHHLNQQLHHGNQQPQQRYYHGQQKSPLPPIPPNKPSPPIMNNSAELDSWYNGSAGINTNSSGTTSISIHQSRTNLPAAGNSRPPPPPLPPKPVRLMTPSAVHATAAANQQNLPPFSGDNGGGIPVVRSQNGGVHLSLPGEKGYSVSFV